MKRYLTKAFWNDAIERTISAVAQSLLLFLTGDQLGQISNTVMIQVDWTKWQTWLTIAGGAAIIQTLKNFVAVSTNPVTGASFGQAVPTGLVRAAKDVSEPGQPLVNPKTGNEVTVTSSPNG